MLIKEYRTVLPISLEEYNVVKLCDNEVLYNNSDSEKNVEVIKNEVLENYPVVGGKYTSGQYTYEVHHLLKPCSIFLRFLKRKRTFDFHFEKWDAYPYWKGVTTSPEDMKNRFLLSVEVMHCSDRGEQENVFELPPEKLAIRQVKYIDIAKDRFVFNNCIETKDPSKFVSKKTGRGPLTGAWKESVMPVMCCYRLVTVEFKRFGIQRVVESLIQTLAEQSQLMAYRDIFCSIDHWYGLKEEDIRKKVNQRKSRYKKYHPKL